MAIVPAVRASLRGSVAARLALGYGLLVALTATAVSAVFYLSTMGSLERTIDAKITSISQRLLVAYQDGGQVALTRAIRAELTDRVDSDTEIVAVLGPDGRPAGGNLETWTGPLPPLDVPVVRDVFRDGRAVPTRLFTRRFGGGSTLMVGRNLDELAAVREVILRALLASSFVSLLAVVGGAILFRRQVERRIGDIRRTASAIEGGHLARRIAVRGEDEFGLLGRDIIRMLDRIEQLMDGVRDVSNAIAHDLRTPLSRVRSRLDGALQHGDAPEALAEGARLAIDDIDRLIGVFDKLLQIAAAEAGMRPASSDPVDLHRVAGDMVELYEAAAEEQGVRLVLVGTAPVPARGDRDLLGNALASLIDNAIKYAGAGVTVEVEARVEAGAAALIVRDRGPGVPPAELGKISQRFYRVDRSRHLPGNGLGLSIVAAIAHLHGGSLALANRGPGLDARIVLPRSA